MTETRIEISGSERTIQALRRAPEEVRAGLEWAMRRLSLESGRMLRAEAPKATTELVNSIRTREVSALVFDTGPTVEHGEYVHEGTEGGPDRPLPPVSAIMDWVKTRQIAPRDPSWSTRDLAWAIARSIRRQGTPANPFTNRVRESQRFQERAPELAQEGVRRGLREAGLR